MLQCILPILRLSEFKKYISIYYTFQDYFPLVMKSMPQNTVPHHNLHFPHILDHFNSSSNVEFVLPYKVPTLWADNTAREVLSYATFLFKAAKRCLLFASLPIHKLLNLEQSVSIALQLARNGK